MMDRMKNPLEEDQANLTIAVVRGFWCCTGLGSAVQREREIDR